VVVIGECHAHAVTRVRSDAAGGRHIFEGAIAAVTIERVGERFVKAGMAIRAVTGLAIAAEGFGRGVPLDIVNNE
jgi:hypothetical protein